MSFISTYQLPLLLGCFFLGCCGTALIFRAPAGSRMWKMADLLWVVLGGLGAVAALVAGVYQNDSTRLGRQIDVAYAATAAFDRDAARFRLRYCEGTPVAPVRVLCDKVEFLSASTATNSDLPLFIAITESAAPLRGLQIFRFGTKSADSDDMADQIRAFDPGQFLAFTSQDAGTKAASTTLRQTRPEIAADYQVLAGSYDDLITQVARLKSEWEFLQANAGILLIQTIALCMIAFAAPFRLGKSLVELR